MHRRHGLIACLSALVLTGCTSAASVSMEQRCIEIVANWADVDPSTVSSHGELAGNFSDASVDYEGAYADGDWRCGGARSDPEPAQVMVYPGGYGNLEAGLPESIYRSSLSTPSPSPSATALSWYTPAAAPPADEDGYWNAMVRVIALESGVPEEEIASAPSAPALRSETLRIGYWRCDGDATYSMVEDRAHEAGFTTSFATGIWNSAGIHLCPPPTY